MDQNIINMILQRQGAPNTPENVNRIMQFAASNPDVMERYGMGMGPGLDDNSALLRLALDNTITNTSTPDQVAQLIAQNQLPEVPMPTNGGRPAPRPPAQQNKTYPNPNEATGSPLQTGGIPGDFNAPAGPNVSSSGGGGNGIIDLLMGTLLGGGAAYAGARALGAGRGAGAGGTNQLPTSRTMPTPEQLANTQPAPAQPQARGRGAGAGGARAPAPYATDTPRTPQGPVRPTRSSEGAPAPYATDPTDPAVKAAMQAEIDAENAHARALQEQIAGKQRAQSSAAATAKAAGRAIRGR